MVNVNENLQVANLILISDSLPLFQQEEQLEARCLALQEAIKQQIPQGTEGEEKGRGYIMSSSLWHSPL